MEANSPKIETSNTYYLVAKRLTVEICQASKELEERVPTYQIMQPILEQMSTAFSYPNNCEFSLFSNLILANLNENHSPYQLLEVITTYLAGEEDNPKQFDLQVLRAVILNDNQELEKLILSSNLPSSNEILEYLESSNTIFTLPAELRIVQEYKQNCLDIEECKRLSNSPANQYLFSVLISMREKTNYELPCDDQITFIRLLKIILAFLKEKQSLDELFIQILPIFEHTIEKLVIFTALDVAVRAREISEFALYLRSLTEICGFLSAKAQIDCIYLLEEAPGVILQTDELEQLKQYTFECLIQNSLFLVEYEAELLHFASENEKMKNQIFEKLANYYEEQENYQFVQEYYKKAGIEQNFSILKDQILDKIVEIVCSEDPENARLDELEKIIGSDADEGFKTELALGKDILQLYKMFRDGNKNGNNEILRLAIIILQECQYDDLKQGILRDLARYGILQGGEYNEEKLMEKSLTERDTIAQAKAILKESKYGDLANINEEEIDLLFDSAAECAVNWRLEQCEDDMVVDWFVVERGTEE